MYQISYSVARDEPNVRDSSKTNNDFNFINPQKSIRHDPTHYSKVKDGLARTGIYARGYVPGSARVGNTIFRAPPSYTEQAERMVMDVDMRRVVAKNVYGSSTKESGEKTKKAIKYARHIVHNEEKLKEKELAKTYEPLADSVLNPEEEKESKEIIDETLLVLRKPISRNTAFQAIPDQTAYSNILADRYGIDRNLIRRARVEGSDNDGKFTKPRRKKK
jgi:hypothetical protein